MFNAKELPVKKQFSRRLVKPDTWIINCYDPNLASPHPHLLIGEKYALLIDPTWTQLALRKYIKEYVTDKPLLIACSHGHHDHTLTNGQFNDLPIYMSQYAWDEVRQSRENPSNFEGYIMGDYTPIILKPGDTIDLGGRVVEVIPYEGCHSPGSLIFLDTKQGILFTGDELEAGQMLVSGRPGSTTSVEKLRDNLLLIKNNYAGKFDMLCPPHNGSPIHALFLDYLIENCERIMNGIEGDMDVASTTFLLNPLEDRPADQVEKTRKDPKILRSEWMGSSIVYNVDRIFRSQVE